MLEVRVREQLFAVLDDVGGDSARLEKLFNFVFPLVLSPRRHDLIQFALVRQARLDPTNDGFRKPPDAWPVTVAKLARERARALMELAEELER